jgi:hypothetical protein
MLVELADEIYANLTSNLTTLRAGLVLPSITALTVKWVLDQNTFLSDVASDRDGIYVSPINSEVVIADSKGRGQKRSIAARPVISICVVLGFRTSSTTGDAATLPEIKEALNLRERIDFHVCRTAWTQNILEVMSEPAMEVKLDHRLFFTLTELTFEGMTC